MCEVKHLRKGALSRKREKGESHRILKTQEMGTFENLHPTVARLLYVG